MTVSSKTIKTIKNYKKNYKNNYKNLVTVNKNYKNNGLGAPEDAESGSLPVDEYKIQRVSSGLMVLGQKP